MKSDQEIAQMFDKNLTAVKMPGGCRSGRDTRGSLIHLVMNPEGRSRSILGAALCGAMPRGDWSGWEPDSGTPCPNCQQKAPEVCK
jgi:hypothetical protein